MDSEDICTGIHYMSLWQTLANLIQLSMILYGVLEERKSVIHAELF